MTKKTSISFIIIGLLAAKLASASVVINEIAWMGTENSPNDEWIELFNNNSQDKDLNGWLFKAADNTPEIQLAGTIPANSFYLLERSDDETVPGIAADQIYTGALNNNGEHLQLYDAQNNLQDSVDCSQGWFSGNNETKQTMERSNGNWQNSQNPGGTPKTQNSIMVITEESIEEEPEPLPAAAPTEVGAEAGEPEPAATGTEPIFYPSGVLITEILPSPLGTDQEEEWVEIYNENAQETNISLWQISDTVGKTQTYTFPEKTIIEGRGFLILYRPVSKITLNNDGDTLNLIQPNGNVADTVTYEKAPRNRSYNRTIQGWKWSDVLTPGAINIVPNSKKSEVKPLTDEKVATTTLEIEKELAAIGQQTQKSSKSLKIFLAALGLAIVCTILIFALKKRLSRSPKSGQNNLHLPFR